MEAGRVAATAGRAVTDPLCDHCDHPQSWHFSVQEPPTLPRPCHAPGFAAGLDECACGNYVASENTMKGNHWDDVRKALAELQRMEWLGDDIQENLTFLERQVDRLEERMERRNDG